MTRATHRFFGLLATAAVAGALIWGFAIIGSPQTRRTEKFDERRLQDLQAIVSELQGLVYDREKRVLKRALFPDLATLQEHARSRKLSLEDPETGEPYGFRLLGPSSYELCASFAFARDAKLQIFWNHPAGRSCWVIDVLDPP